MINFAKKRNMNEDKGQILLYQTPDGDSHIEVRLQGETVWLNLDQMAELFQRNKSTISRHIKNVFEEGELQKEVVVANFATTIQHGAIEGKLQTHLVEYLTSIRLSAWAIVYIPIVVCSSSILRNFKQRSIVLCI